MVVFSVSLFEELEKSQTLLFGVSLYRCKFKVISQFGEIFCFNPYYELEVITNGFLGATYF